MHDARAPPACKLNRKLGRLCHIQMPIRNLLQYLLVMLLLSDRESPCLVLDSMSAVHRAREF